MPAVAPSAYLSNNSSSKPSSHMIHTPSVVNDFNRYTTKELIPLMRTWSMVSQPMFEHALTAVQRVNAKNIAGDIVELGVWKGGMTMGMMFVNQQHNQDRHFWLFDTFEGLPPPDSEKDGVKEKKMWHKFMNQDLKSSGHDFQEGKWNYGNIEVVKNNVFYTGYPKEKIHFIQGKVEDTLPVTALPEKIAILRLDTDWYASTAAEYKYLWDRLSPGGLLIVDDFCAWAGSRTATMEFFKDTLKLDAAEIQKEHGGDTCFFYWKP